MDNYTRLRANEKAHPMHIGFLGAEAIVPVLDALTKLIEQASRVQRGHSGFYGSFMSVCSAQQNGLESSLQSTSASALWSKYPARASLFCRVCGIHCIMQLFLTNHEVTQ